VHSNSGIRTKTAKESAKYTTQQSRPLLVVFIRMKAILHLIRVLKYLKSFPPSDPSFFWVAHPHFKKFKGAKSIFLAIVPKYPPNTPASFPIGCFVFPSFTTICILEGRFQMLFWAENPCFPVITEESTMNNKFEDKNGNHNKKASDHQIKNGKTSQYQILECSILSTILQHCHFFVPALSLNELELYFELEV